MTETNYIPGRKLAPKKLGRVLILGLGKSGMATASYCARLIGDRVDHLAIAAGKRSPSALEFAEEIGAAGAVVEFDHELIEGTYDICIASPGISQFSDFYKSAQAASGEIMSEVEFAWRESAADSVWVAITGTNGKTTTTALCAHILCEAGMNAAAVGNIGDVVIDTVAAGQTDVYVVEVSSYQLASTINFAPQVAVLLNITPDHLKWHGSMEEYRRAKLRVFANLATVPDAVAVLDATNDLVRETVRAFKARPRHERGFDYVPLGTASGLDESMHERCGSDNAAYLDDEGVMCVLFRGETHRLMPASDLLLKGRHNYANALAAAVAAIVLGVDDEDLVRGLSGFAPLEHRIEPCGSVNGVACFNDSKATNVDATLVAFSSFEPGRLIVLLGGDDKGTSLDELVKVARENARAVVCFGAAGPRFAAAFEDAGAGDMVLRAGKLEEALDCALKVAHVGDSVVLSPACASFDEFDSFEHRGREFKRYVACRMADQGLKA